MFFFVGMAVFVGLVVAGAFVWGHKHGVDAAAAAAMKSAAVAAASKEVAGATAAVSAEVAKVAADLTPKP